MPTHRIFATAFAKVYPLYVQEAEGRNRTLMQKMRCLDKLIDELANGKTMEKILRR